MTTPVLSAQRPTISRRWLPWLAAGGYILALTLAFPPFKQGWAVLIFLTPFVKWAFAEPRWRTYLAAALGAGWGSWFCILIWLRHIYPPYGWLGLALLSGYLGLYALAWLAALRWAAPRLKGASRGRRVMGMLALAGWWIVLDWVRGTLFTGFPWLPLAAAFWEFPLLLQLAAWTGQSGVTFMIVLFNLGLVCGTGAEPRAGIAPPPRRKIWWPARCGPEMLLPLALFFGAVLLSLQLLSSHRRAEVRLLRAGIVQPATPALLKWDPAAADKNRDTLLALTQTFTYRDGSRNNVDLVLWPEAALPVLFQGAGAGPNREALGQIVNKLGVPLLLGGIGEAYPRPGQPETPGQFDGVFLVRPGAGFATEVYAKRHLVPFGEYVPLRRWLTFTGKLTADIGDFTPGTQYAVGHLPGGGAFAVFICYEAVFPEVARRFTANGAALLINVSNDGWFGRSAAPAQHLMMARVRAVENRRWLLRDTNNGFTVSIDPYGRTAAEMPTDIRGELDAPYDFRTDLTPYTRLGDWLAWLCVLVSVVLLAAAFTKKSAGL